MSFAKRYAIGHHSAMNEAMTQHSYRDLLRRFPTSSRKAFSEKQCEEDLQRECCAKRKIIRKGFFLKKDGERIQRFVCQFCKKGFSDADPKSPLYRSKHCWVLGELFLRLNDGASLRRCALTWGISKNTVNRYFNLLGDFCKEEFDQGHREEVLDPWCETIQFDEMETYDHSRLRPLAIAVAVNERTRKILSFEVSVMKPKCKLKAESFAKFGFRKSTRIPGLKRMMRRIPKTYHRVRKLVLKSDKCSFYPKVAKAVFPSAQHLVFLSRKACVVGQGELKVGKDDPLFAINHSCAMFRANVHRLYRRTWNTTKNEGQLLKHLYIYAHFHNAFLVQHPARLQ